MAEDVPYGRKTQRPPAVKEVHILWITAGLSCDGDTVSVTAAMQPSIEDVLLGAIPGLPKVHLHNPVLAYEVGDDFMKYWYQAEQRKLDPFVLVVEGSIPNERIKADGCWAALATHPDTGQPITTCEWIDRLAPKAWGSGRFRKGAMRLSGIGLARISRHMPLPRSFASRNKARRNCTRAGRKHGIHSKCRTMRSRAGSMKRFAACFRIML